MILLTTKRLILRQMQEDDLQAFHEYRSDPQVCHFQGYEPMSIKECREYIKDQNYDAFGKEEGWIQYGIIKKKTNLLIGDCGIRLYDNNLRQAEIGMSLSRKEQKKGFAHEAMIGIIDYLFEVKNVHRIQEIVFADNLSAVKALEQLGFRKEAHKKESYFHKGKWVDEYYYGMLLKDWKN